MQRSYGGSTLLEGLRVPHSLVWTSWIFMALSLPIYSHLQELPSSGLLRSGSVCVRVGQISASAFNISSRLHPSTRSIPTSALRPGAAPTTWRACSRYYSLAHVSGVSQTISTTFGTFWLSCSVSPRDNISQSMYLLHNVE